jgi:hypothetical protein
VFGETPKPCTLVVLAVGSIVATRRPHRRAAQRSDAACLSCLAWPSRSRLARPACAPPARPAQPQLRFCAALAQQQSRRSRASPQDRLAIRRRCEVSIVYALVTLFHHVARFK